MSVIVDVLLASASFSCLEITNICIVGIKHFRVKVSLIMEKCEKKSNRLRVMRSIQNQLVRAFNGVQWNLYA